MKHPKRSGWAPEAPTMPEADAESLSASGTAGEPSIIELVQRVVTSGRSYAETEIERQKVRAGIITVAVRDAALLGLIAIFLLFGAMTALVVGCLWVLAPIVGVVGALAITIGSTMVFVIILLIAARARFLRGIRLVVGKEGDS